MGGEGKGMVIIRYGLVIWDGINGGDDTGGKQARAHGKSVTVRVCLMDSNVSINM